MNKTDEAIPRPTEHKGVTVAREELTANLPTGAPFRISRLHLTDGTTAFACRDCLFTGDNRGEVAAHRNATHGTRYGKRAPKLVYEPDDGPADLVLPPRPDGSSAPDNPLQMTVAELLALLPTISGCSDLIEKAEYERDLAQIELEERRRHDRENNHKIQVYESNQNQLVELRMKIKNAGSFDELKAEVVELRSWKKKMIAKLSALGFKLTEEEQ